MIILLKSSLVICLLSVFCQDFKDRLVSVFLFPLIAVLLGIIHYLNVGKPAIFWNVGINLGLITVMLIILYSYVRIRAKNTFKNSLGLGDVFCFFTLAFSFASIAFITFLVFGLIFALVIHSLLSRKRTDKKDAFKNSIPLAGYLCLFFTFILIIHWLEIYNNLYVL